MKARAAIALAASVFCMVPAEASEQPEFLDVEALQLAAEEREELRLDIRNYVRTFVPVCPFNPPEAYRDGFSGFVSQMSILIESLQSTQLLMDVNIAYYDELEEVKRKRATVRCGFRKWDEASAQNIFLAALRARQDIEISSNRALRALSVADEALEGEAQK